MSDDAQTTEIAPPEVRWSGQSIRVEHLVAPGGWLMQRGTHLRSCSCRCADIQTCPRCGDASWPSSISGRWDAEHGHTARPFDAVWVKLTCGCEFGDADLAKPTYLPVSSGGDA